MKNLLSAIAFLAFILSSNAQFKTVEELDAKYLNWFNSDFSSQNIAGTSVDKAYSELLVNKQTKKTVIVAVIDSGVDINHEDLKGNIWINEDEIPNNNIDDDNNGYIDDINGWNFIGGPNGEHIVKENYEITRLVRENDESNPLLPKAKSEYKKELEDKESEMENLQKFQAIYIRVKMILLEKTGVDVQSEEDLKSIESDDPQVNAAKDFLVDRYSTGFTEEVLNEYLDHLGDYLDYYLNLDFDIRGLVNDDPKDITDKYYGNADVTGPRADHGTSVAGIIAAKRNNDIGIDGIATDVRIMALRSVPNGDERDKDIALSIIYAVDNGADIINMSFGKSYSPQKEFVDQAVKYAEERGVLLIHASGNSAKNIDIENSYPSDRYIDNVEASNWLNVGASTYNVDKGIAAVFSNYGAKHVDIFAPGENIISTDTASSYRLVDGTSFAAPVATGIAALMLSYYPDLTPNQLIEILMSSAFKFKKPKKVFLPNEESEKRKKVKFTHLSKSGGIINAYDALLKAEKYLN